MLITKCGTVGDEMQEVLDKSDFSIIMTSGNVEDRSEYWQEQCQKLYDSIVRNLSEGSIKPLEFERDQGERIDLITIFSTLVAFGIKGEVFVNVILDLIKNWLEYRPTAEIEIKCPDGSTVKISKLPLSRLSKFFEENPKASICEGLNQFKISNE
jgi:hypothetical protein